MPTQAEKGHVFQSLHRSPGTFVIPNPWDAGTARLLAHLGFPALATTSAGFAFSIGRPDAQRAVGREEVLTHARNIAAATDLPVSADLEGGFGDAPETVAETIRLAAATGIVGGSIEDATGRRGELIYPLDLAIERVRAAVDAARALHFPFTLTARAENFLYGRPNLADTIRRLQAFQEAGADVLYAPGLRTSEDISAVVRSVDRPVNVLMGLKGTRLSVAEVAGLGVKRISVGGSLSRAALGAFLRAAHEIRDSGSFRFADDATPTAELNTIFAEWTARNR